LATRTWATAMVMNKTIESLNIFSNFETFLKKHIFELLTKERKVSTFMH
jgi:hypothetical protein